MHQFGVREEMHSQLQNKFMNMNWVSLEKRNPDMVKMSLLRGV